MNQAGNDPPLETPLPSAPADVDAGRGSGAEDLASGGTAIDSKAARAGLDDESQPPDDLAEGALHPATLWLPLLERLLPTVVPAFIACFFVGITTVLFFVTVFVVLPVTVFHTLRFFSLRYQLAGNELVINSGFVFRRERRIPFDRVQEIEIHQTILHRLLRLARLEITTAGSDAQEANLNVLTMTAAESIKARTTSVQYEQAATPEQQPDRTPDYRYELSNRDLVLGGLTSNVVATLGAVVAAIVYFQLFFDFGSGWASGFEGEIDEKVQKHLPNGSFIESIEDLGPQLPEWGPFNFVWDLFFNDTLYNSVVIALLGLGASIVTYVVRYHHFELTRTGDLLGTAHGLLTIRRGSLSRDRIQALKLEEGLLRRWVGLASVRADSAGDRSEIDDQKKRDVLVPAASKESASEVARQAIPGLVELEPPWQRVSPKAVIRGSKKGWLLILAATIQTGFFGGFFWLMWLPAVPLVFFLNERWYRHTGYWLDEQFFLSRKGWLNRSTVCLPVKNIQNVSVIQSYFDRRLSLATISIDIAGQSNTGGGPRIRHLPVDEARRIQQTLARRAADCEFRW